LGDTVGDAFALAPRTSRHHQTCFNVVEEPNFPSLLVPL